MEDHGFHVFTRIQSKRLSIFWETVALVILCGFQENQTSTQRLSCVVLEVNVDSTCLLFVSTFETSVWELNFSALDGQAMCNIVLGTMVYMGGATELADTDLTQTDTTDERNSITALRGWDRRCAVTTRMGMASWQSSIPIYRKGVDWFSLIIVVIIMYLFLINVFVFLR